MQEPEFHQNRYARELDEVLVDGSRWLDIGAGHGVHHGWIGPSGEDLARRAGFFAGCDLGSDVLDHPFLHEARVADASELPWEADTFDLVTANMVVEHLEQPLAVLEEVHRVLKPGGAFLFVTPNLNHPVVRISTIVPKRVRRWYRILVERAESDDVFPTLYRLNTVQAAESAAAATGFEVVLAEVFRSTLPVLPSVFGSLETLAIGLAVRAGTLKFGSNLIAHLRCRQKSPGYSKL